MCVWRGGDGRSCHCSHLGAGKFTLSVQGRLQPLATDWTALTQIHSPQVLQSETCDQRVGRAELPREAPGEGPSGLVQPVGSPGLPGLVATSPQPLRLSAQTFCPGWLCASDTPSSLPKTPVIKFRVHKHPRCSGAEVSNLLPSAENFHRNKSPLPAAG